MTRITARTAPAQAQAGLLRQGLHPVLARLLAARGVRDAGELAYGLDTLLAPSTLLHCERAAAFLADCIERQRPMVIVADYDCDGATACAVGLRALQAFGARVGYFVPNRAETGYGLSPQVVDLVAPLRPEVLITVDNGIASVEGVAAAAQRGILTLVTDHHLPGAELPAAECIVNPNQPGCGFESKSIAGVGVMFYVMLALRSELRRRGAFAARPEPNLGALLDLVALGTVADVVRLDRNNRLLVAQGLKRIRGGRMQPGLAALFAVAGRDPAQASAFDLGFALGPRLNAAGRLADMSVGIEALVTDDMGRALNVARELDRLNRERRDVEAGMHADAEALVAGLDVGAAASLVLFEPSWHQGVVGLVASRVKDRHHRPTVAFAPAAAGDLRGSGRSIPGLHLRDALDLVAKRSPGLILRFGGHAAAAGLTLRAGGIDEFRAAFDAAVREMLDPALLARTTETDGPLEVQHATLEVARLIDAHVWGQGFPQPLFADDFAVEGQRLAGERHLRLKLARDGRRFDAILFRRTEPLPPRIRAAYRLGIDSWNGAASVQLALEDWEAP
jgi:single-stranded-DNA-specific exonuclease